MRLLEIIVIIIEILTLVSFGVKNKARRLPIYFVLLSVFGVLLQVALEGGRWQMAPAYALAVIYVIWLIICRRIAYLGRRWIKASLVILGGIWIIFATALPLVLPVIHLNQPTGEYGAGTVTYDWVDNSRPELFTTNIDDRRELTAQIWYPVDKQAQVGKKNAPYISNATHVLPALANVFSGSVAEIPSFTFSHLGYAKSNATLDTPITTTRQSFPVLIYLSGLGGGREFSMFQVQELVSQGYVVVGIDQPGASASVVNSDGQHVDVKPKIEVQPLIDQSVDPKSVAPSLDGTPLPNGIISYFSLDVSFVIDQLANINASDKRIAKHLDLQKIGIFGVSLGGMIAGQACVSDDRLKACLIMDVAMTKDTVAKGIKRPTMWLTRTADTMRLERSKLGGWSEADIKSTQDTMYQTYSQLPSRTNGYFINIENMFHTNFTDGPLWTPLAKQIGISGPIGTERGFTIVNAYSVAFFNTELKKQSSNLLKADDHSYDEVKLQAK